MKIVEIRDKAARLHWKLHDEPAKVKESIIFNFLVDMLEEQTSGFLERVKSEGENCPTCKRYTKVYRRKLNSTMARGLIWLYREGGGDQRLYVNFAKMPPFLLKSNQLASNRWWDLVERAPNDDPAIKHSGMWRLTVLGRNFVKGFTTVKSHIWHYNSELLGRDGDYIKIDEALGKHFNYSEMMAESHEQGSFFDSIRDKI